MNEHKLKRTSDISFFYLTSQLTLGSSKFSAKIRLNSRKCSRMNQAKCQGYNISIIWKPQIHFNTDINITLFHIIWHTKRKKRCCQRAKIIQRWFFIRLKILWNQTLFRIALQFWWISRWKSFPNLKKKWLRKNFTAKKKNQFFQWFFKKTSHAL